ncbi:MAG: aldose 1-epimerase [Cyclobacteriaceae bacterium]
MAFSVTEYKFGNHRGLMVYHNEKKHHIDIVPSFGALLARIEFFGHELVEPLENSRQLENDHWYRNFWLMPFQNRIADGRYVFDHKTYQLPVNEPEKNNAIHGFFQELDMIEMIHHIADEEVTVKMDFHYDGSKPGYPFPFDCNITYHIHARGTLTLNYTIHNIGTSAMPFSCGWHPYFQLEGDRKTWKIIAGPLAKQPLNHRNLPEGAPVAYREEFDLGSNSYDDCFRFEKKPHEIILSTENQQLKIIQDDLMPYVQIFTPPRNSVAIEPISSSVDAFNNKKGLQVIQPSDSLSGSIALHFTQE